MPNRANSDANRRFAVEVVERLREAGHTAYWAGGCVRDFVRGEQPEDYDVATDALPDVVRNLFGRRRTLAVGESFGVVVVLGPSGVAPVEVATFRTEGPYLDGRRPDSVAYCSPEEDARRRDFTINGMFYDPLDERVLDFVGGRDDLERRIVRAIGDPAERMREDKLRLLRAVRFAAVFDFAIEEQTAAAIRSMAPQLGIVSVERITQELRKMLVHENRRRSIVLCRDLGLMASMLPEWLQTSNPEQTLDMLQAVPRPSFELAFAVLLRELPNPHIKGRKTAPADGSLLSVCRRLRLSNDSIEACQWLHAHQANLQSAAEMSPAGLKRFLAHPLVADLLKFAETRTRVLNLDPAPLKFVRQRQKEWSADEINPPPLLTGHDLLAIGYQPGPRMKELLDDVREAQLNCEIRTRDEALQRVSLRGKK